MAKMACITSYSIDIESHFENKTFLSIETKFGVVKVIEINDKGNIFYVLKRAHVPTMPHQINYRANLLALKQLGVDTIISSSIVGAINNTYKEGDLVLIDQFIDFTSQRSNTIFESDNFNFIDMTEPYCNQSRNIISQVSKIFEIKLIPKGCYIGVDGPRFETKAEINMFKKWGGDVIGMSNIPEVIFARELEICYCTICLVSNLAAGLDSKKISIIDINLSSNRNSKNIISLFLNSINKILSNKTVCNCN